MYQVILTAVDMTPHVYKTGTYDECMQVMGSSTAIALFTELGYTHWELRRA